MLPEICTRDRTNWLFYTYIIFWEIVEEYLPNRVMRQFGLVQTIPINRLLSDVNDYMELHSVTRRGAALKDWGTYLGAYIKVWDTRDSYTVTGIDSSFPTTVEGYMDWYWPRTVLFITNPSPGAGNPSRFQDLGGNFELLVGVN